MLGWASRAASTGCASLVHQSTAPPSTVSQLLNPITYLVVRKHRALSQNSPGASTSREFFLPRSPWQSTVFEASLASLLCRMQVGVFTGPFLSWHLILRSRLARRREKPSALPLPPPSKIYLILDLRDRLLGFRPRMIFPPGPRSSRRFPRIALRRILSSRCFMPHFQPLWHLAVVFLLSHMSPWSLHICPPG